MKRKLEMKDSQEQRLHYHDFWIEVLIRFWKYSNTYFRWTLIEWDWPAWNLPRTPILIQLPFGKPLSTCQTSAFLDIKKHRSCRRAMPSQATFWAFAKCQLSSLHTGISSICYCTAAPCTCLANFPWCFILQFLMSLGQLLWVGGGMMWRYNPLCPVAEGLGCPHTQPAFTQHDCHHDRAEFYTKILSRCEKTYELKPHRLRKAKQWAHQYLLRWGYVKLRDSRGTHWHEKL